MNAGSQGDIIEAQNERFATELESLRTEIDALRAEILAKDQEIYQLRSLAQHRSR